MFCPVCRAEYPADYKVCPKDATHLLASARIGKYQIEALIGIGGMGAVYRSTNPDTKARVAIKLMNPAVAGSEPARARFQREAAAVAALRTTHVVKVYDFGTEADGTLYLVMELLDGHSLSDEIRPAPARMDLARVQMVMDGSLKGLAAAHRAGIVHRDLKPDNVFVADTDDGEVPKLLDFGIARVTKGDSDLTRTGSLMGTAAYMAVEQVSTGTTEIGPWSDVYAMGTILYEMLAGIPAYDGETLTEVLHRVLVADAVPLAKVRPGLPAAIYDLVERCMSRDVAKRPQDAEAMRLALATAQLVPTGTAIPPPTLGSARRTELGNAPTEGRDSSPTALAATALPAAPAVIAAPPAHAVSRPARDPVPPSTVPKIRWPLIIGGLAIAIATGVLVMQMLRTPSSGAKTDAAPAPAAAPSTEAPKVAPPSSAAAPPSTAPAPAPSEPTAAPTAPCSAKDLRAAAHTANKARRFKQAIELATQGLSCGGNEDGLHAAIVFAACKLRDDKLVMKHYYARSRLRVEAVPTICIRQRTAPP